MSIARAVSRAFLKKDQRGWDRWPFMFWVIDLHDVIIPGTYTLNNQDRVFYPGAREVLSFLSSREDMYLILWTSSHPEPLAEIRRWMETYHIKFDDVNRNSLCEESNDLCNFEEKMYADILLDDKAGFDGLTDWVEIKNTLEAIGEWRKKVSHRMS